jgi:DNA polymerase III subunit alpha
MTACALTDHAVMGGIVDFYKQCKANHIKPLLGVEAYITEDQDGKEEKTRDNSHLILIAKNETGLRDLCTLSSEAALNNFYYKPRIYKHKLQLLSGNVIVATACIGGILAKKAKFEVDAYGKCTACTDPNGDVGRELEWYRSIFQDDFYLELQSWDDGLHHQREYNRLLMGLGQARGTQFVITSDAHYLRKEDHSLHELLMAMQIKKTIEEYREAGEMQYGPYFYVKTPEELLSEAKELGVEEAYYNTMKIAEQCNVEIELGKYKPPTFKIEEAEDYPEFKSWLAQKEVRTNPR